MLLLTPFPLHPFARIHTWPISWHNLGSDRYRTRYSPLLTVNKGGGVAVSVFGTLSTNGFLTVKGDPSPESGFAVTSGRATFAQDVMVSGAITIGKDATLNGNITVRGTGDITFVNGDVAEELNVVNR